MTTQQIKKAIRKQLENGVFLDKLYTMQAEKIEVEINILMEELRLIYKLSNVQSIYIYKDNIKRDTEFNYIEYALKIRLDFGCYITATYTFFVCYKAQ